MKIKKPFVKIEEIAITDFTLRELEDCYSGGQLECVMTETSNVLKSYSRLLETLSNGGLLSDDEVYYIVKGCYNG